jgi:hypothetical protein
MLGPTTMLATMLILTIVWAAPVLLVAASRRATGLERAVWALVCVFASWLGYVAFLLGTRRID